MPKQQERFELPAPRLDGKTVLIAGKVPRHLPDCHLPELIAAQGGRLVQEVGAALDFLFIVQPCPTGRWAVVKQAEQLNSKQGAHIQIIDMADLFNLLAPTRDEALALLHGGEEGIRRWNSLRLYPKQQSRGAHYSASPDWKIPMPSLAGASFHTKELPNAYLWSVELDGCDFRAAGLDCSGINHARNVCFDGACLKEANVGTLLESSLVDADLTGASLRDFVDSNFTGATLEGSSFFPPVKIQACKFCQANLRKVSFAGATFAGNDFTGADLSGSRLERANLTGERLRGLRFDDAVMVGCNLTTADLSHASLLRVNLTKGVLVGADLRHATLRGANLAHADLTGANLQGADFTDANVSGAKIDQDQLADTKGLSLTPHAVPRGPGPHLEALAAAARTAQEFKTTIVLEQGEDWLHLEATHYKSATPKPGGAGWRLCSPIRDHRFECRAADTIAAGMATLAEQWRGARPVLESVRVESKKEPRNKDLWQLAVCGWAEAFGIAVPDAGALQQLKKDQPAQWQRWRELLLEELRQGAQGVARWNQRGIFLHEMIDDFSGADLRRADLTAFHPYSMNFIDAHFDEARISEGHILRCQASSASFQKAGLERTEWEFANLDAANFSSARLRAAFFYGCVLQRAVFAGADLHGARFKHGRLQGADLSTANLEETRFESTEYDETTRWPAGFILPKEMRWVGQGPNPAIYHPSRPMTALDFDGFMALLAKKTQPTRLAKALAMLKAERFQLYAEVTPEALSGVVKSQTDPDLAYSCRLLSDGAFACCTQNLRICGGLRDALCKHLLVLVVGLAKADQLDRSLVDRWVEASHTKKALLDKDAMSETFIRYKGAEAGEVDWRPTETIPEDYYAL